MNNKQKIVAIRRKAKEHGLVFRKSDKVQDAVFLWEFTLRSGEFKSPLGNGHWFTLADAYDCIFSRSPGFLEDLRNDLTWSNTEGKK